VIFYANTKQQEKTLNLAVTWMAPLLRVQDAMVSTLGRKPDILNKTSMISLSPSRKMPL